MTMRDPGPPRFSIPSIPSALTTITRFRVMLRLHPLSESASDGHSYTVLDSSGSPFGARSRSQQ